MEERLLPVPVHTRLPARNPAALPSIVAGGVAALVLGRAARWAFKEIASGMMKRALTPSPRVQPMAAPPMNLPPGTRIVTRVWWQSEVYVPPAPAKGRRWPFG